MRTNLPCAGVLVLAIAGCDRTPPEPPPARADAAPAATPSAEPSASASTPESSDAAVASAPACAPELRDIYLVSDKRKLFRLTPSTHAFKQVGTVSCPVDLERQPTFGIDRSGTAWMVGTDDALYKVNIHDAKCSKTTYTPSEHPVYRRFAGAFSTDTLGDATETLYVADNQGSLEDSPESAGLATLDTTALQLKVVGTFANNDAIGYPCALAGNFLGKLYGVFGNGKVYEINKKLRRGTEIHAKLDKGPPPPTAYWGGSLWLFHPGSAPGMVTVQVASGLTLSLPDKVPAVFASAGSSTCAPSAPAP